MHSEILKQNFGTCLRFLRKSAGLTQASLAQLMNITEEYVGKVERGLASPSFDVIARLCKALDTDPASLFQLPAKSTSLKSDHCASDATKHIKDNQPKGQTSEQALQREHERYRNLFEHSPISLWEEDFTSLYSYFDELRSQGVTDFDAHFNAHPECLLQCSKSVRILDVNRATLQLMEAENKEQLFAGLHKVLTKDSMRAFREEIIILANGGDLYFSETTHRTLKGNIVHLIIHFKILRPEQVVVSLIDITKRKRHEELCDDAQRIMNHDLRLPLATGANTAHIVLQDDNLTPTQTRLLDLMEQQQRLALDKINRLIILFRIEDGSYVPASKPTDILQVASSVLQVYSNLALEKNLQTRIIINGQKPTPGELHIVNGERALYHSLLDNLLKNAIDASPANSLVEVRLDTRDGCLLEMSNQGIIPKEIRDRFFEKYVTSHRETGTGIGTYAVKLIAEAMNGSVSFTSNKKAGTTVTVHLPKNIPLPPS